MILSITFAIKEWAIVELAHFMAEFILVILNFWGEVPLPHFMLAHD
jgi:hypothetical protein